MNVPLVEPRAPRGEATLVERFRPGDARAFEGMARDRREPAGAVLAEPVPVDRRGRDRRQETGRRGERAAARALRDAGLRILQHGFRARCGEIDLIAEDDGGLLVFVEVKTRRGSGYGAPARSVTAAKRARIARVALVYLQRRSWLERPCRFDVVEVRIGPRDTTRVRHIPDAFRVWPSG